MWPCQPRRHSYTGCAFTDSYTYSSMRCYTRPYTKTARAKPTATDTPQHMSIRLRGTKYLRHTCCARRYAKVT